MDDFMKEKQEEDFPSENIEIGESVPSEDKESPREISADLIRGHINTIILRTLIDGEKYGYEIISEIEEKSHGQYTLKQPTLYSALKRLEAQGYVSSYWGGVSNGGRRRYFNLTEEGRKISTKNIGEWEYSRTIIDSLISENDFNFDNPAPSPVDMKILKQSTSRVPNAKNTEEEPEDDNSYSPNNKLLLEYNRFGENEATLSESTSLDNIEISVIDIEAELNKPQEEPTVEIEEENSNEYFDDIGDNNEVIEDSHTPEEEPQEEVRDYYSDFAMEPPEYDLYLIEHNKQLAERETEFDYSELTDDEAKAEDNEIEEVLEDPISTEEEDYSSLTEEKEVVVGVKESQDNEVEEIHEDIERIYLSIDENPEEKDNDGEIKLDVPKDEDISEPLYEEPSYSNASGPYGEYSVEEAEESEQGLPEAKTAVKNYIDDTVLSDYEYTLRNRRSKIDSEYRNTLNRIYATAITEINDEEGFEEVFDSDNNVYSSSAESNAKVNIKKILNADSDMIQEGEDVYKGVSYMSGEQVAKYYQYRDSSNSAPQRESDYNEDPFFTASHSPTSYSSYYQEEQPQKSEPQHSTFKRAFNDIFATENSNSPTQNAKRAAEAPDETEEYENNSQIDFSDIRQAAKQDGIKVYTACGARKVTPIPEILFNKSLVLLKTSFIVFFISLLEGLAVAMFKDVLEASVTYSAIMILIPAAIFAVCAVLYFTKANTQSRRISSTRNVTTATIAFLIAVMAICSFSIYEGVKLISVAVTMKYIIIPCVYSFNIVLFAIIYHALSRKN